MKEYVLNLIPRLKKFSESLSKRELFIDIPWAVIDEKSNQQKYIFKRNGEFVMSINGQVTVGKWEYLASANSLLIDRISDKILLNHAFLDVAVMALKFDGSEHNLLLLANHNLIPDLDVFSYLRSFYITKNKIKFAELSDGRLLEVHDCQWGTVLPNMEVTLDGEPISDGILPPTKSGKIWVMKDSRINKILVRHDYETREGVITIERQENSPYKVGDIVFKDGQPAPDGKYRLGFFSHITVENGRIAKA